MTRIASYFAEVGVGLDKSSLAGVRKYLNSIEKQMQGFQRRMARSSRAGLALRINRSQINRDVRRTLADVGKNLTLTIGSVKFAKTALNKQLLNRASPVQIYAALSTQSLNSIRAQVRAAFAGSTITPNVRVRGVGSRGAVGGGSSSGGGGSPRSHTTQSPVGGRNFSPWHNPMMVGGGLGAFLRYGPYSLPFVAGAFGLNAMANQTIMLQGQDMMLNTMSGDRELASNQRAFLGQLGERLGIKSSTLTPSYAQVFSAARGTPMEEGIQEGFSKFMDYAAVTGLNDEDMRGALRAVAQMVGKGQVMSEELKLQLGDRMPSAVRLMAEAVADGDVQKLFKKMEQGEVLSADALPKFFDILGREAENFLEDYYKSVRFWQGQSERNTEEWFKRFMSGGVTKALAQFYQVWSQIVGDSIPMAERLGGLFQNIVKYFSAAMLVPSEVMDWFKGGKNNFMQALFGDVDDSQFATSIIQLFRAISQSFSDTVNRMTGDLSTITSALSVIGSILASAVNAITAIIRMTDAYDMGGFSGMKHELARGNYQVQARQQAIRDLENSGMYYDASDVDSVTKAYMMDWDSKNPAPRNSSPGTQKVWSGALGEGLNEASNLISSGNFSLSGLWDVLNRDRSHLLDVPNSLPGASPTESVVRLHITSDPLTINANVEAHSTEESMKHYLEAWEGKVLKEAISLAPVVAR